MVSTFSNSRLLVLSLKQLKDAIGQIAEWNKDVCTSNDYTDTPEGMKTLAATSMLIEAIGEGIKKIERHTDGNLLKLRPEIPWRDIMAIRNYIAHGYFDIDADLVLDVVKNDLKPLEEAISFLLDYLSSLCENED